MRAKSLSSSSLSSSSLSVSCVCELIRSLTLTHKIANWIIVTQSAPSRESEDSGRKKEKKRWWVLWTSLPINPIPLSSSWWWWWWWWAKFNGLGPLLLWGNGWQFSSLHHHLPPTHTHPGKKFDRRLHWIWMMKPCLPDLRGWAGGYLFLIETQRVGVHIIRLDHGFTVWICVTHIYKRMSSGFVQKKMEERSKIENWSPPIKSIKRIHTPTLSPCFEWGDLKGWNQWPSHSLHFAHLAQIATIFSHWSSMMMQSALSNFILFECVCKGSDTKLW